MTKLYPKPCPLNPKLGFTLLELIVVIAIIGILVSIAIASYASVQQKSRDSRRKSDLLEIKSALVMYFQDFDTYPGEINKDYPSNASGDWIPNLSPDYFKSLPQDIKQSNTQPSDCQTEFIYCYQKNGDDSFILWAQLENLKDFELRSNPAALCQNNPPPNSSLNYCLKSPQL